MRVIDSSSLSKYVNREASWKRVEGLLKEGCTTLELALKEVGNSVWKRVVRGELTPDIAISVYKDFVGLRPFKTARQEDLYAKALQISTTWNISLYDALFIELSRELNLELVTSDEKQAEVSEKMGVKTIFIE